MVVGSGFSRQRPSEFSAPATLTRIQNRTCAPPHPPACAEVSQLPKTRRKAPKKHARFARKPPATCVSTNVFRGGQRFAGCLEDRWGLKSLTPFFGKGKRCASAWPKNGISGARGVSSFCRLRCLRLVAATPFHPFGRSFGYEVDTKANPSPQSSQRCKKTRFFGSRSQEPEPSHAHSEARLGMPGHQKGRTLFRKTKSP